MSDQTNQSGVKLDIGQTSSPQSPPPGSSRWPWLLALVVILAVVAALWVYWGGDSSQGTKKAKPSNATGQSAGQNQANGVPGPSQHGNTIKVDGNQQSEQDQRKKPFGLDKSVDAVARSDESIQVGDKKVPVEELERKLVVEQRGEVREKSLQGGKVSAWGVHMVRPGDNLWQIHYQLLREYLAGRGVNLPPRADQPQPRGYSTGVGKILKFAEHMVGVYNLRTGQMTKDLNLLEPGRKVVIFNLSEIFAQLDKVDPKEINGVLYDGRVLFFPKPDQVEVTTKEMESPAKTTPGQK
ncbi:MAG: hypothetical protein K9L19_06260 [Desulfarculaceae bacterium]|nr:hypothetical protein [Desulfarculaceae bacterium]MCF8047126.1 hypothetical protein [Desulfarculaceae bacterium]MCF8120793.1 hypothetical protein [Desulfarculaceae bacterium]